MIEYRLTFEASGPGRIRGCATCGDCGWRVSLVDDTKADIDAFLTRHAIDHALAVHDHHLTDKDDHEAPCPGPR
jgi:hypothetical protein